MATGEKGEVYLAKVIVLTSGKGGVGKTTSAAAVAAGLALRGKRTVVIDFDVGLRNLDLIMGCERRVVFDFINVINGDAKLNQALIKDKRNDNLYIFPTSQTRDKDALKRDGVERVLDELKESFDYIVCDSPAGIEHGAITALYFADSAIITTTTLPRRPKSLTTTAPTPRSTILDATSPSVSSGATASTSSVMMSRSAAMRRA